MAATGLPMPSTALQMPSPNLAHLRDTVTDSLSIELDEALLPGIPKLITLQIVANVGGNPSPVGPYPLIISASFDTEPLLPDPSPDLRIGGGAQVLFVVPD
jgi:hypothetical protein